VKELPLPEGDLRFDEIGYWTETKLDLIRDYAEIGRAHV